MLDKLAELADELDAAGLHAEADTLTNVMRRVAGIPGIDFPTDYPVGGLDDGPIRDFQPDSAPREQMSNSVAGDHSLDQVYATLKAMGIDDAQNLKPDSAIKIFQAIMASQMHSAFASAEQSEIKKG